MIDLNASMPGEAIALNPSEQGNSFSQSQLREQVRIVFEENKQRSALAYHCEKGLLDVKIRVAKESGNISCCEKLLNEKTALEMRGLDISSLESESSFLDVELTGKGTLFWPNGDRYKGDLVKGEMTGKGIFFWASGNRYEGDFVNGERTGKGAFFWADGDCYKGEFVKDKRTGKGTFFWTDGDRYEGDFINGVTHGKGKFFFANGDRYEGDFVNGEMTGKGKALFANGDCYEGEFANDKKTGKGKFSFANGDCYEGEFVNDKRTGKGKLSFANGDYYEGDFLDGEMSGQGKLSFGDGSRYEGRFSAGLANGYGEFFSVNGDHYTGFFLGGAMHGPGNISQADGVCVQANFARRNTDDVELSINHKLFLQLLLGVYRHPHFFPEILMLGILSVYLEKTGYVIEANTLKSARQIRRQVLSDVEDIPQRCLDQLTTLNQSVFLPFVCKTHIMGLNLVQRKAGYIDCEIFNSGAGILQFHRNVGNKFETALRVRVLKEKIDQSKMRKFLFSQSFNSSVKESYDDVLLIDNAEVLKTPWDLAVLQTPQKSGNCTLEWIFAYLKNTMGTRRYNQMRMQLFKDCIQAIKEECIKTGAPLPTATINELQRKIDKRVKKLESTLL